MSKKNPLTASERRGILIVAAIALLVTGSGMIVGRCDRPGADALEGQPPRVEVLLSMDSLDAATSDSVKSARKRTKKKSARTKKMRADSVSGSKKKSKEKRTYHRRNPLDESVDQ